MKTTRFSDTGVLWRLATFYGPMYPHTLYVRGTDICTYTRAVLYGAFRVFLVLLGSGAAAAVLGDTLAFWVAAAVVGTLIEADFIVILGTMAVLLAVVLTLGFTLGPKVSDAIREWMIRHLPDDEEKPPSQLKLMIEAWKNKYCFKVEFKDSDAT